MMFHFKQFSLTDTDCAMKIGTDAVLLGSWTDTHNCSSVLDIGTGCGILSLMLAQKSKALIDAVEIDEKASLNAKMNFESSSWKTRLKIHNSDIKDFRNFNTNTYDLVISNPPFFLNSLISENTAKSIAKHTISLSYEDLIHTSEALLNVDGLLNVILPYESHELFQTYCERTDLKLLKKTIVIPVTGKLPNRVLMSFMKTKYKIKNRVSQLIIRGIDNKYTASYLDLTKDYLLNS